MEDTNNAVALRDERGRMITPLPGKHTITKADASILAKKRWAKYRQEAVKRITGEIASVEPDVSTGSQAFGVIAAKQALALLDSEKPRINDLVKLAELMTGKETGEESRRANAPAGEIVATPAALLEFIRAIEADKQQAVDKARAIDAEAE